MNVDAAPKKSPPAHRDGLRQLTAVVHDLRGPGGCPWDREQTHESLVSNLIEECYEAVEAIRSGDREHMEEELGDLLLQVVMHAEIASESAAFDLDSIAHAVSAKLIRRHPHVYGDSDASDTEGVLRQWDAIKRTEKGGARGESLLHGVGKGLPAVSRAAKLQKKAAKVGFDWPDLAGVLDKVREETEEIAELVGRPQAQCSGAPGRIGEEIGDLLFSAVNFARKAGLDPEVLLAECNQRFIERFAKVESTLAESGTSLELASLEDMEAAWQAAKR